MCTKQKRRLPYICLLWYMMTSHNNQVPHSLMAQVLGQFIDNRRVVVPNPVQAGTFGFFVTIIVDMNGRSL